MKLPELIFIGINGSVIALNGATGEQVWVARLKGYDFVSVLVGDGKLYATSYGEAFCLDPLTGAILWHNRLKGYGTGLSSIATLKGNASNTSSMLAEKKRRDQQQAAVVTT